MIRCLAPAPAVDVTYLVDRVARGQIHRPELVLRRPGGKAFNVARTVGCLGGMPQVVGPVGGLSGAWIVDAAAAEGIEFDAIQVAGHESRTCVSVCTAEGSPPTDFYETSHPVGAAHWQEFVARVEGSLVPLSVLSGSLPPDVDVVQLADLVRATRPAAAAARLLVDLGGPVAAAWLATAPAPDVLKVNVAEAAQLTGFGVPAESDVTEVHRLAWGLAEASQAELVIVTRGSSGGLAIDATGAAAVLSPPPPGAHPVGSGDAFMGALAVGLAGTTGSIVLADPAIRRLLQTATAAAADNATRLGAGVVDVRAVRRLAEEVRVEPLV